MKTSVIVPLYKSRPFMPKLLETLAQTKGVDELIFVSDGDGPYTVPGRLLVEKHEGYAAAVNRGARAATGDYLCLLNADTWSGQQGWLLKLTVMLDIEDSVMIAAPAIYFPDGREQSFGSRWNPDLAVWEHITSEPCIHEERDMVTFACALIRRTAWDDLGGLNEDYSGAYWEDADFCMRVREQGGRIVIVPSSHITHVQNSAGMGNGASMRRNGERFRREWVQSGRMWKFVPRPAPQQTDAICLVRQGARGDVLMATAIAAGLRGLCPQRRIIFATDMPDVLEGNPDIDQIVPTNHINRARPDVWRVVDLRGALEARPDLSMVAAYAECCRGLVTNVDDLAWLLRQKPRLAIPRGYQPALDPSRRWVALHYGPSPWTAKHWPFERWQAVVNRIHELADDLAVVVLNPERSNLIAADRIWLTAMNHGAGNLRGLLGECTAFVGIESFPAHVAQVAEIPTVILSGPTTACRAAHTCNLDGEMSCLVMPVHADTKECQFCGDAKPRPQGAKPACVRRIGGFAGCMMEITVDQVMAAMETALKSAQAKAERTATA